MQARYLSLLTISIFLFLAPFLARSSEQETFESINISSTRQNHRILIKVRAQTNADINTAWETITDYKNASVFISNLISSEEERVNDSTKKISQVGRVGSGIFSMNMRTTYLVNLDKDNRSIAGELISGDVKSMLMQSSLMADSNNNTVLNYSLIVEPSFYIPSLLAEQILISHAKQSFSDLLIEMERRAYSTGLQYKN